MKSSIFYRWFIILTIGSVVCSDHTFCQLHTEYPVADDLRESGPNQRRDLSIPGSRIVINYYDFSSRLTAAEYSNGVNIPLNVAYLTTLANKPDSGESSRMGRTIKGLLSMYVSAVDKNGTESFEEAASFETEWTPHSLPFSARYNDSSSLRGDDFFYDENTIVRRISFESLRNDLLLKGKYKGKAQVKNNAVVINHENINYAIQVNHPNVFISIDSSSWCIRLPFNKITLEGVIIAIALGDNKTTNTEIIRRTEAAVNKNNAHIAFEKRKLYWNTFISKVPHPGNYDLHNIDTKGVHAAELQKAYYKAWIFTAQNLLFEDPENFPYPQICTGKASLWDEGHVNAPFSAAWESFLGIQFYAYINTKVAWKAFKGLMSLVDSSGMLGGESLPSRKAQTALLLYNLSGDIKSLGEVYPALCRYLNWRLKITHWVYGNLFPSESFKDADFAFSALIDIQHMISIADKLHLKNEVAEWKFKQNSFFAKCLNWFWESPQTAPFQYFDTATGKRSAGHTIWLSIGLYVKPFLSGDYLVSMMKRFDESYDTNKNFCGFVMPKYPDLSYSVYGLISHGFRDRAIGLVESNLRDIVRTNASFAEQYIGEGLQPDGVRPSLFGSCTIIDFCMLKNGYKYDTGYPEKIWLEKNPGGVKNILYMNKRMNISFP